MLELGGCWSPDAVAAVHWSLANRGPAVALREVSPNSLPCPNELGSAQGLPVCSLSLGTKFGTITAAWKGEIPFLISSHVSSSSEGRRTVLLHLTHQAAGREEEEKEASRIGWWSSSFSPDAASLNFMVSVLFQLSVASTLGPNRGLQQKHRPLLLLLKLTVALPLFWFKWYSFCFPDVQ